MVNYPEHDKMRLVKRESQALGEFLDWLSSVKRYELFDLQDRPIRERPQQLIAEFLEIDLEEIDREKDQMLDELRRMNGIDK